MTSVHNSVPENNRSLEDRLASLLGLSEIRERTLDKTIEDSFPASDPPSTDPAPEKDSFAP